MISIYKDEHYMYYDGFKGEYKSAVIYYLLESDWVVAFKHNIIMTKFQLSVSFTDDPLVEL